VRPVSILTRIRLRQSLLPLDSICAERLGLRRELHRLERVQAHFGTAERDSRAGRALFWDSRDVPLCGKAVKLILMCPGKVSAQVTM